MKVVKRTLDEWAVLIADMHASNLSQAKWCSTHNINLSTLRNAQVRLKKQETDITDTSHSFVGIEVAPLNDEVSFVCGNVTLHTSVKDAATILKCLAGD
jgi:hypothetical protein